MTISSPSEGSEALRGNVRASTAWRGQEAVVQDLENPAQKGASGIRLLDGSILTPDGVGMSSPIGAVLVLLPHLEDLSSVDEIGCLRQADW